LRLGTLCCLGHVHFEVAKGEEADPTFGGVDDCNVALAAGCHIVIPGERSAPTNTRQQHRSNSVSWTFYAALLHAWLIGRVCSRRSVFAGDLTDG